MKEILRGENLIKRYGGQLALDGVSLSVGEGEFVAVTGRSGSGKSTLLKCIGSMLRPDEGRVILDGKDLYALSQKEICRLRNEVLGFVFQSFALEEKYTAFENIEIPLILAGKLNKKQRKGRITEVAQSLGIDKILDKVSKNLSGGEKQRVAVARAIVNNPRIVFADEPCGNLDRNSGRAIMGIFKDLKQAGYTVVMVTHHQEDAACADRVLRLDDGRLT